ncbi:hypothetical protein DPMN_126895 [Dreissena polymorpha]|uniref:Uncharacterized protein n=1 Tax=Dreissena polymorpha TaxID=45954 RepID=A0A9D4JYL5_DREPO|nr:hypothetical protein DPMN_126895 [Dreissena polymorpha]
MLLFEKADPSPGRHFHEDWALNKLEKTAPPPVGHENCPAPGGHVFQPSTNVITQFHEDWTINVTYRVFELDQDIIGTNLWTYLKTNLRCLTHVRLASRKM